MTSLSRITVVAAIVALVGSLATPASAGCRRMGFTVNDYGKEGPTRDAKNLLDKHIETWASEQGIEKYSVGKKSVSCELFLDLVLFDEHTCTATATVCWGDRLKKKKKPQVAKKKKANEAKKTAEKKADEKKPSPVRTVETVEKRSADADKAKDDKKTTAAAAATATPVALTTPAASSPSSDEIEKSVAKAEDSANAAAAAAEKAADTVARIEERLKKKMETGAIQSNTQATGAMNAKVTETTAKAAEAAASAAERAALAAERAAAAAERAAAALNAMPSSSSAPKTTATP